jgi:Ca2+-binding EF-hand superfamily protein
MTEEACLIKMFKYFDMNDSGAVDFPTFHKALVKCGMGFPEAEL